MEKTAEYAWVALRECFTKEIKPQHPEIEFNEIKKEQFVRTFCDLYEYVKKTYMTKETDYLDRHKQAAILVCCVLKEDVLVSRDIPKDKRFVGKYSMALALGLSFLCDQINEQLLAKGISNKVDTLTDIEAFACPTDYFNVLFRNLYFEETAQKSVFVLTLANTLFLLEYIALSKQNIDLNILKEYASNENNIN